MNWRMYERKSTADLQERGCSLSLRTTLAFMQGGAYHIKSVATNEFLRWPVKAGDPLTLGTTKGEWVIDPPPDPNEIVASTIYSALEGLYAGVDHEVQGTKIIAVTNPYKFEIAPTPEGLYSIYPVGTELYWASNSTISPAIELIAGSDIKGNEGFFNITPVENNNF
ncbi:uncharacterized protein BX664DRAFT_369920 [Halteromyces radiatus]|uniref:uncharacterized protein n=1 Tax=Halteromyces radiatus TaxID=101107 RepID=UPI002220DC21|nr:uncharacterized protein BX664DRAFT_369920 [Halteromyces radiatus]KAI8096198.1 hypothetical protein BX664DRAFT_369920 [Halteromyces radiatus]